MVWGWAHSALSFFTIVRPQFGWAGGVSVALYRSVHLKLLIS